MKATFEKGGKYLVRSSGLMNLFKAPYVVRCLENNPPFVVVDVTIKTKTRKFDIIYEIKENE